MKYHEFMRAQHQCRRCQWQGNGSEMELGDVHEGSGMSEYHCPKCNEYYGAVSWPEIADYENGRPQ